MAIFALVFTFFLYLKVCLLNLEFQPVCPTVQLVDVTEDLIPTVDTCRP